MDDILKNSYSGFEILGVVREHATPQTDSPMEYLYMLELYRQEHGGKGFIYLENPFRTFYGLVKEPEIAQLYTV